MVVRSPIETAISGILVAVLSVVPVLIYYHFDFMVPLVDPSIALGVATGSMVVVSWFLLTLSGTDRTEYILVWLIVPIVSVLTVWVVLFPEWGSPTHPYPIEPHPFAMVAGGLVGIGVEFAAARLAKEFPDVLSPIVRYKAVLIVLVLLVPIGFVGLSYASPGDATIEEVDFTFSCGDDGEYPNNIDDECPIGLSHTFATNFSSSGDALYIAVETPTGITNDRWFSADEVASGPATVVLSAHSLPAEPPMMGNYTVTIESKWGHVLDEQTVQVDRPSTVSVTDVRVIDAAAGTVEVTAEYDGNFRIELSPDDAYYTDANLDFDGDFSFDGPGTDTVRATVVDDDGEATSLEPGEYTLDLLFTRVDERVFYTFEVEE